MRDSVTMPRWVALALVVGGAGLGLVAGACAMAFFLFGPSLQVDWL